MSSILVVGNFLKDVYLRLDERSDNFELDENETPWLNLGFDGSKHNFFHRTSIFGGAAVTMEVLQNFNLDCDYIKSDTHDYRYVLCHGDKITYFVPSERTETVWEEPTVAPDWIFVDRSANISTKLTDKILGYLKANSAVKLAVYMPKKLNEAAKKLGKDADLVFAEKNFAEFETTGEICMIKDNSVSLDSGEEHWNIRREDLMTHLTLHSVVAATVLGATVQNCSVAEALRLAKINVENSTLSGTLSYRKLRQILADEKDERIDLRMVAKMLMTRGKGILAADESGGSIHKKFEKMSIPDTADFRRDYRNIFFTTKELEKYISGVILFDETTHQKTNNNINFVDYLTSKGIVPGIKVDGGLEKFAGSTETYTKGLDGLEKRLQNYYDQGLRFAKWRAAFEISDITPTKRAIQKNCEILADYALACQRAKIVPIVEPEVVYDGDYSIRRSAEITSLVLKTLFENLAARRVDFKSCILKCNMVIAGKKFPAQSTAEEVGKYTAEVLRSNVPKNLAGVVFLSGGQTPEQATENLQAVTNNGPFPWPVTFSFARALQEPALLEWRGYEKNEEAAREAFHARLVANAEALKIRPQ